MKQGITLRHEFVEFVPDDLIEGTVYVSMKFATVVHKCCCGCGKEVVTPLTPTDWKLTFDGKTISLNPSIGNWGFECRSHYWITNNEVRWAEQWSQARIDAGRSRDLLAKAGHRELHSELDDGALAQLKAAPGRNEATLGMWRKVKKWLPRR